MRLQAHSSFFGDYRQKRHFAPDWQFIGNLVRQSLKSALGQAWQALWSYPCPPFFEKRSSRSGFSTFAVFTFPSDQFTLLKMQTAKEGARRLMASRNQRIPQFCAIHAPCPMTSLLHSLFGRSSQAPSRPGGFPWNTPASRPSCHAGKAASHHLESQPIMEIAL